MAEVGSVEFQIKVDNGNANKALDETTRKVDALGEEAKDSERKMSDLGSKGGKSMADLAKGAAIAAAVMKIGKAWAKVTNDMEEGRRLIVRGTGATGKALEGLERVAHDAFSELPQDYADVANGIAEVNTRFGFTGDALKETTIQFAKFAKNSNSSIQQVAASSAKLSQKWNVDAREMPKVLDKITAVAQASGVSMSTLLQGVEENGNAFQAMGLSLDDSISLLGSFEKHGVNAGYALMAMKQSFAASGKAGRDAKTDWEQFTASVMNASTEQEAAELASRKLGSRMAAELTPAIQQGAFQMGEFAKSIEGSGGATGNTFEAGKTSADNLATAMHEFKTAAGEAGEELGRTLIPMLTKVIEKMGKLAKGINEAGREWKNTFGFKGGAGDGWKMQIYFELDEEGDIDAQLEELGKKLKSAFNYANVIVDGNESLQRFIQGLVDAGYSTDNIIRLAKNYIEGLKEQKKAADDSARANGALGDSGEGAGGGLQTAAASGRGLLETLIGINDAAWEAGDAIDRMALTGDRLGTMFNAVTGLADAVSEYRQTLADNAISAIQAELDAELAALDEETEARRLAAEEQSAILEAQYERGEMSEADYLQRKTAMELEAAAAEKQAEERRKKMEEEAAARKNEIARKQFESDKANRMAQVWMDTATAVMRAFADAGWIGGGVIAALLAAQAGVQTATISAQQYVPSYLTGIRDVPENQLAFLHQGEMVLDPMDAGRYRDGLASAPSMPVIELHNYMEGGIEVDGVKLASVVLRNMNDAYRETV